MEEKLCAIDKIIDALFVAAAEAAGGQDLQQYSLDDGQVKISSMPRDAKSIQRSIEAYERMRHYYLNRLNGRGMILKDHESTRFNFIYH
jgi:hypothetical protein